MADRGVGCGKRAEEQGERVSKQEADDVVELCVGISVREEGEGRERERGERW